MDKFNQTWTNFIWTSFIKFGKILSNFDTFNPIRTCLINFQQISSNFIKLHQVWTSLIQSRQVSSNLDTSDQVWKTPQLKLPYNDKRLRRTSCVNFPKYPTIGCVDHSVKCSTSFRTVYISKYQKEKKKCWEFKRTNTNKQVYLI